MLHSDPPAGATTSPATTQTARIEIHSLATATLSDKQFLTGVKDGVAARIGGELRLPDTAARVPAIVLLHGSAGIGANVDRWAQELNGIGVAAFVLDCFTGRGIVQTVTDQAQLGHLAMVVDAFRALALLSCHQRIDAARIAVMGFSKGGFAALYCSLKRFQRMHGPTAIEFAAYIPFYPPCNTTFLEDDLISDRPIRVFHGASDDYVAIEPCRKYVERLRRAGKDVKLTEYPGTRHVFDNPLYPPLRSLPDAIVSGRCLRAERADGEIVDLETGKPCRADDPCVSRGATVGYNPAATAAATESVKEFLVDALGLAR